jgi:S1-C subfamily serine protease
MKLASIAAALALCATYPAFGQTDTVAEAMRSTADKYKNSCVNVAVVLSMTFQGEKSSHEIDVPGVVIDGSGMVAVPNYAVDPGQGSTEERTTISSVKILTPAGVQVDAKVVLRDPIKQIAFVRPVKPLDGVTAVDFSAASPCQTGDMVFIVGDLGTVGNRAPRVTSERIVGTIEKPRKILVVAPTPAPPFGNAAFNVKGEPVGFVTMKTRKHSESKFSLNSYDDALLVIIPGEDIVESAKQAPQIKDLKPGT